MVGSKNSKYVNNYDYLAYVYDDLLADRDAYRYWLEYLDRYTQGKRILELASGSGLMAQILKEKGYQVTASDINEHMLMASKRNYDGEYLILDMRNFRLNRTFDTIICICDSFNYLNDLKEVADTFTCVSRHLSKNGTFIFDMHAKERLDEFAQMYIEEGDINGLPYQWTIQSDRYLKEINEHFAFYLDDRTIEESHTQHVFDCDEIKAIGEQLGFKMILIEDFIEKEKILMIGEKI